MENKQIGILLLGVVLISVVASVATMNLTGNMIVPERKIEMANGGDGYIVGPLNENLILQVKPNQPGEGLVIDMNNGKLNPYAPDIKFYPSKLGKYNIMEFTGCFRSFSRFVCLGSVGRSCNDVCLDNGYKGSRTCNYLANGKDISKTLNDGYDKVFYCEQ